MKKQVFRGIFDVTGRNVPGILTLNGNKSTFELWSDQHFSVQKRAVHGTTDKARGISVLACLPTSAGESLIFAYGRAAHDANVTFHIAVVGDGKHLQEDDESIVAIRFEFDELRRVARLHSAGPYGYLPNPDSHIVDSLERYKPEHAPDIEKPSAVIYFGGDRTILPRTTVEFGTVSITRGLDGRLSGGVVLDDKSSVTIDFPSPVTIHRALDNMRTLRSFFTLIIGHLPTVQAADIATAFTEAHDDMRRPKFDLKVYSIMERVLGTRHLRRLRTGDRCLLDCGSTTRTDELISVMRSWLDKNAEPERRDANWRFFNCFRRRVFSIDRIIAAANMFDLLPRSDWPHPRMQDLKKKVHVKADLLLDQLGSADLPRLHEVTDHAIDCRNHYVHGNAAKLNYERSLFFLTNTLEFVYGVSQLIECGWNSDYLRAMQFQDHPFSDYLMHYEESLSASGI